MPPPVIYKAKPHTQKQRNLLNIIVENQGVSLYSAMVLAGYSHATAKNPRQNLKGFQELLEEHLPDHFLLSALEEDIKNKKGNRKGEIELALRVKGRLKSDGEPAGTTTIYNQTLNQQNIVDPSSPTAQSIIDTSLKAMMAATKRKVVDHEQNN